jgi:uncharacterized protein YcfL
MKKLCIASLVLIALTSCGDTSASSTTTVASASSVAANPSTFKYTMTIGENTGSDVVIEVIEGQTVELTIVNPDSHDDVHLHGYDLSTGLIDKGQAGVITFTATKTGEFDIESHETEELVSILKVAKK